ncbi:hypothetical protein ACFQ5M_13575 [Agrilactobacillus yilanensis]|uniref:Uncharacterized protein n=1 Tax=Agrilactobacillus yilanensis TaxID=2485997 RepID=A0ABW4JDL7_9LACO|nr:hypothetical protein [Agrilactobacillus yilanensis]
MAKNSHRLHEGNFTSKQELLSSWSIVNRSEQAHCAAMVRGVELKLLKIDKSRKGKGKRNSIHTNRGDITPSQLSACKAVLSTGSYGQKTFATVSSHDHGHSQAFGLITSGMSHSPYAEMQRSSRNIMKNRKLAETVVAIAAIAGRDKIYAYQATLTQPNADFGELDESIQNHGKHLATLGKWFVDGARRHGYTLAGANGTTPRILGAQMRMEITHKTEDVGMEDCPKLILSHVKQGLYHDHSHVTFVTDTPLDLDTIRTLHKDDASLPSNIIWTDGDGNRVSEFKMTAAAADLFLKWCQLNPDLKLSAAAFKLQRAYGRGLIDALAESTKYEVSPKLYSFLMQDMDDWAVEVYCETMKAIARRHLIRETGLFRLARSIVNRVLTTDLAGAFMQSVYKGQEDQSSVPSFYTAMHVLNTNNDVVASTRQMTAEQALYFNKTTLAGAGFDARLIDSVSLEFSDSERQTVVKSLLRRTVWPHRGKAGLLERLTMWETQAKRDLEKLRANLAELEALELAYEHYVDDHATPAEVKAVKDDIKDGRTRYDNFSKNNAGYGLQEVRYQISRLKHPLKLASGKYFDVRRLRLAVMAKMDDAGNVVWTADWRLRMKKLAVLETMRGAEKQFGISWADFRLGVAQYTLREQSQAERDLKALYGDELMGGGNGKTSYIDSHWYTAFKAYVALTPKQSQEVLLGWNGAHRDAILCRYPNPKQRPVVVAAMLSLYGSAKLEDAVALQPDPDDVFDNYRPVHYADSHIKTAEQLAVVLAKM